MAKSPFYKVYLDENEKRDISEFVEGLKYEDCTKKDSMLEFTIKSDYTLEFADDDDLVIGQIVLFQFGLLGEDGDVSEIQRCKIQDIEVKYASRVTVTVRAFDNGVDMKRNSSNKVWKNLTSSQIVSAIAQSYGMKTQIEATTLVRKSISQGHKTDSEFIHSLAKKESNGNYIFYVRNNTVYFVKRGLNQKSVKTFNYGYDNEVVSFFPKWRESTQEKGTQKTTAIGFDPLKKQSLTSSASDTNQKQDVKTGNYSLFNSVADKVGSIVKSDSVTGQNSTKGTVIVTPTPDKAILDNMVNANQKDATLRVLTADLVTDGDPLAKPDTVITMKGVAQRHGGNWYIEKVTHSLQGSAYTNTSEMVKNAVQKPGKKNADKTKVAEVNKSTGPNDAKKTKTLTVFDANGKSVANTESGSDKFVPPTINK